MAEKKGRWWAALKVVLMAVHLVEWRVAETASWKVVCWVTWMVVQRGRLMADYLESLLAEM